MENNEKQVYQQFQERMKKVSEKFGFIGSLRDNVYSNYEIFQTVFYSIWNTRNNPEVKEIFLPMSLVVTIFERHYNISSFNFEKIDGYDTCFFFDGEKNKTKMESLSAMILVQIAYSLLTLYSEEDQDVMHKVIVSNVNARFGQIVDDEQAAAEGHVHGENCSCGK